MSKEEYDIIHYSKRNSIIFNFLKTFFFCFYSLLPGHQVFTFTIGKNIIILEMGVHVIR